MQVKVPAVSAVPSFPELLERLVAQATLSSASNLPAVDLLTELLDGFGASVLRQPSKDESKANLIAFIGPEPDSSRDGLTLCGHLDVVPAEEEDWDGDPFVLADLEDRWRGRGTADMQGFIALATLILGDIANRAEPLHAPLALLFTYDEEVGSLGAQRFAASWKGPPLPRATLIGEPTELRAVRLHKGHQRLRLVVHGEAAHSAYPKRGRSAIEAVAPVISLLITLRHELEGERSPTNRFFPEVPFVTLNLGQIRGGTAINIVPDRCELEIGLRPLPAVDIEALVDRVRETADAAVADARLEFQVGHLSPAMETSDDAPIHRTLCDLLGQAETISANFSSDAGFLSRAGHECVLFGPGSITVAHRANEYLPKQDVQRAREVVTKLIHRFCTS